MEKLVEKVDIDYIKNKSNLKKYIIGSIVAGAIGLGGFVGYVAVTPEEKLPYPLDEIKWLCLNDDRESISKSWGDIEGLLKRMGHTFFEGFTKEIGKDSLEEDNKE